MLGGGEWVKCAGNYPCGAITASVFIKSANFPSYSPSAAGKNENGIPLTIFRNSASSRMTIAIPIAIERVKYSITRRHRVAITANFQSNFQSTTESAIRCAILIAAGASSCVKNGRDLASEKFAEENSRGPHWRIRPIGENSICIYERQPPSGNLSVRRTLTCAILDESVDVTEAS